MTGGSLKGRLGRGSGGGGLIGMESRGTTLAAVNRLFKGLTSKGPVG